MNKITATKHIQAEIRAIERRKNAKPEQPAVRIPCVNYATGRLIWH